MKLSDPSDILEDVLVNQLRYTVVNIPSFKTVHIVVGVCVGSKDEDVSKLGISHLIEHLIFKSNERFTTKYHLYKELDLLGSNYNAFTSQELTVFHLKTHVRNLEKALDTLGSIVCDPMPKSAELEAERSVVCEEIRNGYDNPIRTVESRIFRMMYPNHPLCRNIAGSVDTIRSITLADVRRHMSEFYVASNMYLCIVGGVNLKDTKDMLEKGVFNHAPVGRRKVHPMSIHKSLVEYKGLNRHSMLDLIELPSHQPIVCLGFPAPNVYSSDKYVVDFINNILVGTMTGSLSRVLREEKGYVYSISTDQYTFQEFGLFLIKTTCDLDKLYEVVRIIWRELQRICVNEISTDELSRRKNIIEMMVDTANEGTSMIAEYYIRKRLLECGGEDVRPKCDDVRIDRLFTERYAKVKPRDIRRVCKRMFRREYLKMVVAYKEVSAIELSKIRDAMDG